MDSRIESRGTTTGVVARSQMQMQALCVLLNSWAQLSKAQQHKWVPH